MNNLLYITHFLIASVMSAKDTLCDFDHAINAFHASQNERAVSLFSQCLGHQDYSIKSHFYIGISYRNLDKLQVSASYLKKIMGKDNDNISYYLEYAYSLEKAAKLDQALEIYQKAVLKHPENLGARLGEARINHWLGNINPSISLYRALVNDHPNNVEVDLGLAFALMADRKLKESNELFVKVLDSESENVSAIEGLRMLSVINNYSLIVATDYIRFGNVSTTVDRLEFESTPDYSLKWGARLLHYRRPINSFSVDGTSTSRSILNELSFFSIYKSSENNEILGRITIQDLFKNNNLYKIKLEDYYTLDNKNQVFLGATQSFINSELVNTLSTIGISIKKKNKTELIGRFFYSSDKFFQDSQSVSTSIIKTTKRNDLWQFGASANQTGSRVSFTVFGTAQIKLFKNCGLVANITRNSKDKYFQASFGVKYEF
ncbi:MAG: tetratricopeptide repeat protein [Alcanivoracaceae bacterium]|nr:tetratricopeptide repeat protein [Alcanivoracaceae bacterium]